MIFAGTMFIGVGIGFIFGNEKAGALIGMGVGFILQELYRKGYFNKRKKDVSH